MKRHGGSPSRVLHGTIGDMNTGLDTIVTAPAAMRPTRVGRFSRVLRCVRATMRGIAVAVALPATAAPAPISVPLTDGSGARLHIDSVHGSAQLLAASAAIPLRMNSTLRDALSRSDTALVLGRHRGAAEPDNSLLLFISAPSRPAAPMGYCGAGQEDGLLLLAVRDGALVALDVMMLQSCLHSIAQAVDLADPATAFRPVPAPWLVSFAAMQEDTAVQRCVGIRDERLTVQDDCTAAPRAAP
jgi:hypothetical protein